MDTLIVDQSVPADEEAVWRIFTARDGALTREWRLNPGSSLLVVRDGTEVVAFAILRADFDRAEFVVDNLECERDPESKHATVRGVRAMATFGEWLEGWIGRHGGGEVISCVGADNRAHEQALKKVGYVDRVHMLTKRIEARGEG